MDEGPDSCFNNLKASVELLTMVTAKWKEAKERIESINKGAERAEQTSAVSYRSHRDEGGMNELIFVNFVQEK